MARTGHSYIHLPPLAGALRALRREYEQGYVRTFAELVHAETFGDFLDMASHLLEQGYKDPSAVLAGSVLEQHLRELAKKNGIACEISGKPKKADLLNAELAGADVYSKLDQKNVTSWLGLRNEAAHGNYSKYTVGQVELMVQAVRDFMTRHIA